MTSLSRGCGRICRLTASILLIPLFSASDVAAQTDRDVVLRWNKIAEDTITPKVFQNEGLIYMAYVSAAIYDAVVVIEGSYEPYALNSDACSSAKDAKTQRKSGSAIEAHPGASVQAAVATAAYQTLVNYFPVDAATLNAQYAVSLAAIPASASKQDGIEVGLSVASQLICLRAGDNLPPYRQSSLVDAREPGPGVWRLTPPYALPQTPWIASVEPFVLNTVKQFHPAPPPNLSSPHWVAQFNEVKHDGSVANAGTARGATATFWTANVISQYNRVGRELAVSHNLDVSQSARLLAMINIVGADAQIAVMHWKYHFLFWRPVTAIDPCSVTADGFGPATCDPSNLDTDRNPNTIEEVGWRPFLSPIPNHPEYPGAHGSITGAVTEVLTQFFGTSYLDVDIHGLPVDTVRHYTTAEQIVEEVTDARTWGGLHYRGSTEAGVRLGRKVANFDLNHAFRPDR